MALAVSLAGASQAQGPAQSSRDPAWFGVPRPGPVSDLDRPTFVVEPNAYGPQPIHFKMPRDPSGALDGARMMADMRKVVEFSRESRAAGEALWGRISGMPAQRGVTEWTVDRLKAAGLSDARVEQYPLTSPIYWPTQWEVKLVADPVFGAGSRDVVLQSAFPVAQSATTAGVLSAPLVFVGRGSPAELANIDVRGKVAVVNVKPDVTLFASRERGVARAVADRGAVAVINAVESPGNFQYFDTRYGCGTKPCFMVGGDDGAFLEAVIGRAAQQGRSATLRAAITLKAEMKSGLNALNGVATISGRSREVIIVNSHTDAWFDGANDNADGMAVFLALAEHFAKRGRRPARTLVFVASGGHHTGNGPAAFIAAHPEIMANTVMVINLEHLAQIQVTQAARLDPGGNGYGSGVWGAQTVENVKRVGAANTTPYVMELLGRASKRYGVTTSYSPSESAPGDLGAYIRAGKPSIQLISSEVYYHSSGDNPSTISEPGMLRAAAFFVDLIDAIATAPRERLIRPETPAQPGGGD
jgi:hypothetical protein